jgi:MFS family permease
MKLHIIFRPNWGVMYIQVKHTHNLSMFLLICIFSDPFLGFSLNGFNVAAFLNVIDIAPAFSGTVTGITNGFSATSGFLVPIVTSAITSSRADGAADPDGWKMVFATGTMFYVVAVAVFAVFGRAEPEPFNVATHWSHDGHSSHEEDHVETRPLIS